MTNPNHACSPKQDKCNTGVVIIALIFAICSIASGTNNTFGIVSTIIAFSMFMLLMIQLMYLVCKYGYQTSVPDYYSLNPNNESIVAAELVQPTHELMKEPLMDRVAMDMEYSDSDEDVDI